MNLRAFRLVRTRHPRLLCALNDIEIMQKDPDAGLGVLRQVRIVE
ncbi:hypothetical protein AAW51_2688 [Caldimonas brevitalea]|uniref:Uncharacterized protein n=1 Tax=Caldimonas brevitalea TaxID=413882 RepID=A0A0G3BIW0_9BURK|nr:hypothetical protein AAW51_2688 [Caldimonas brevitalea]